MGYKYAVVGAGRQGIAAAYDLGKFGDADEILLLDIDEALARRAAEGLNALLKRKVARGIGADVGDIGRLRTILKGVKAFIGGVHFPFNPALTDLAIEIKSNMCDFGGNTGVVRAQLERDADARRAGVTIVPDCGMGPGLNVSLATYVMSLLDEPREVLIWDGGLPQNPEPPWNYAMTFNIGGLTNEYCGHAYFLRRGKITEVPCFGGYEVLDFPPPLGTLEAFVTSGGLSTAPWTFEGRLERLENKTLRYPGHWAQLKAFADLGLLETEPIAVDGKTVVPRDMFHALFEPQIFKPEVRDVCVMRVKGIGKKNGRETEAVVELIDYYDPATGFTAMQRLTGWHASIIAILATRGKVRPGAVSVELAVPGKTIVEEARRRGLDIKVSLTPLP
ncbi:MAG: saccharopine dehydrogenase C-terminal domain-containing protein [Candidatus Eisenbacteria bacterium]